MATSKYTVKLQLSIREGNICYTSCVKAISAINLRQGNICYTTHIITQLEYAFLKPRISTKSKSEVVDLHSLWFWLLHDASEDHTSEARGICRKDEMGR